jgi:Phage portal protein
VANRTAQLIVRPLANISQLAQRLYQPGPTTIGVDLTAFFGPLEPTRPIAPIGIEPRQRQYEPGANLNFTVRANTPLTVEELRQAASYDLVRVIIENVEDSVSRLDLNIRLKRMPGESGTEYAKRKPDMGIVNAIAQIIEQPNSDQNRGEFMRQALEDMLVLDAASVLMRKNRRGELLELRAIDGGTIVRYIDEQGYTPLSPKPAYAQVWFGIPMVDLNTDQLLYCPRNLKSNRLYGMPPVEQAIDWINIGIERLKFVLAYYTDGTIPDAIQFVPRGAGPDLIKETQDWIVSDLAGKLGKRRGIRVLQGFGEKAGEDKLIFPKETLLADTYDDLAIRYLCFAFGTSPQRLLRMQNRATAQANQESADKEGLEPWLDWVSNSLYGRLIRKLGFAQTPQTTYEATFEQDTDIDPKEQAIIDQNDVKVGLRPINEVRTDRGQPALPQPECDEPLIITATGAVPISMKSRVEQTTALAGAMGNDDEEDDDTADPPSKKKPAVKKKVPARY